MPMLVAHDMVDTCTRTLLGGISVDGGATPAQLAVLARDRRAPVGAT